MIRATGSTAQTESEESPSHPTESETAAATAHRRSETHDSRTLAVRCLARADRCPRRHASPNLHRAQFVEGHRLANGLNAPLLT